MQDTLILESSPTIKTFDRGTRSEERSIRPGSRRSVGFRRILFPFDLSPSGVHALRAVAAYAEKTKATVHLLHVVPPSDAKSVKWQSSPADDHLAEASERMLKHWVAKAIQGRAKTFVSIRIGDPVDAIVARGIATRADLIVMTSRSCSGVKYELQRSAAERVSRLAPCPVLTILEQCADELASLLDGFSASDSRTVLVPVGFSTAAEHALRFASEIAETMQAQLLLAHGLDADEFDEPSVHERLASWAERFTSVPFQTALWPGGNSLYAILSEAVRAKASLIVLPTRVQSWARRLRAGSITDGVLRQAPCPVISINENIATLAD